MHKRSEVKLNKENTTTVNSQQKPICLKTATKPIFQTRQDSSNTRPKSPIRPTPVNKAPPVKINNEVNSGNSKPVQPAKIDNRAPANEVKPEAPKSATNKSWSLVNFDIGKDLFTNV